MAHEMESMTVTISLAEYEARLKGHDWHYAYSDMICAYNRGKTEDETLRQIAEEGGAEYKALYNYAHQKMNNSSYWKPPFPEAWPF